MCHSLWNYYINQSPKEKWRYVSFISPSLELLHQPISYRKMNVCVLHQHLSEIVTSTNLLKKNEGLRHSLPPIWNCARPTNKNKMLRVYYFHYDGPDPIRPPTHDPTRRDGIVPCICKRGYEWIHTEYRIRRSRVPNPEDRIPNTNNRVTVLNNKIMLRVYYVGPSRPNPTRGRPDPTTPNSTPDNGPDPTRRIILYESVVCFAYAFSPDPTV